MVADINTHVGDDIDKSSNESIFHIFEIHLRKLRPSRRNSKKAAIFAAALALGLLLVLALREKIRKFEEINRRDWFDCYRTYRIPHTRVTLFCKKLSHRLLCQLYPNNSSHLSDGRNGVRPRSPHRTGARRPVVPPQTEDKEPGKKEPREQNAHLGAKILAPRRLRKGPTDKGVQLPRRGDKERVSVCHVHLRFGWRPLQASQPQGGCPSLRRHRSLTTRSGSYVRLLYLSED